MSVPHHRGGSLGLGTFAEQGHPGLSYLANEDKGLPTRPFRTPAKILHQLIDEVHSKCRRCCCVQFLHHFTDLEGRKHTVTCLLSSEVTALMERPTSANIPTCRRSSGQKRLCLHTGSEQWGVSNRKHLWDYIILEVKSAVYKDINNRIKLNQGLKTRLIM